jgi:hypothetical protein
VLLVFNVVRGEGCCLIRLLLPIHDGSEEPSEEVHSVGGRQGVARHLLFERPEQLQAGGVSLARIHNSPVSVVLVLGPDGTVHRVRVPCKLGEDTKILLVFVVGYEISWVDVTLDLCFFCRVVWWKSDGR